MIHILGSCAILLSAAFYLWEERKQYRMEAQTLQDLIEAMENMETSIRWEKRTLPDTISAQERRRYAGNYFREIRENVTGDSTLQTAWNRVFSRIKPKELSSILCAVSLSGDSTFLMGRFAYAAAQIRELQAKKESARAQKQKLKLTAALSGAGVVIILLI